MDPSHVWEIFNYQLWTRPFYSKWEKWYLISFSLSLSFFFFFFLLIFFSSLFKCSCSVFHLFWLSVQCKVKQNKTKQKTATLLYFVRWRIKVWGWEVGLLFPLLVGCFLAGVFHCYSISVKEYRSTCIHWLQAREKSLK